MKLKRQTFKFAWLRHIPRIDLPISLKVLITLAVCHLVCSCLVLAAEDKQPQITTKPNGNSLPSHQQSASLTNQKRKPQHQHQSQNRVASPHQKLILERMLALASGTMATDAQANNNNASSSSAALVANRKRNATDIASARNDEIEALEPAKRFFEGTLAPSTMQRPQRPPLRSRMVPTSESMMPQVAGRELREQQEPDYQSGFGEQPREQVMHLAAPPPSLAEPQPQVVTSSRVNQPAEVALAAQHQNEDDQFGANGFNHRFGPQSTQPVEPASPLLTPFTTGSEKRSSQIKVVFNNNPQFIIGREHTHHATGGDPFQTRGSHRRTTSVNLQDPDHDSDESSPGATKVLVQREPCDKGKHGGDNIEHIDMSSNPVEPQAPEPPQVRPISPLPPPPKQQQPVQQQAIDQQVDTPFEQIVKSGMRPPLRMVISMRNKNGDMMKMPINLRGASKKQQATFDLGSQMQIHFEPPEILEQQQQQAQAPVDENTPIGGDVFDPSIVKPFSKAAQPPPPPPPPPSKTQEPLPLPVTPLPPPPPPPPQQPKTQFPEKAPVRPPRKQPQPTPEVKTPPVVQHPIQQQVQVPQVVEDAAPVETPPPPTQTKVEPPPVQNSIEVPQQPVSVQVPQVTEMDPAREEPYRGRHHDCHHHHHHHDEQQQHQVVEDLPDSVQEQQQNSDTGLAQLMGPALGAMNNKTFADMFAQFQKALADQMQIGQQRQQPTAAPQTGDRLRNDVEEDDIMVAMMAANLTASDRHKQMSMTVITPPRGTSVADAIRVHADPTQGDPSRTVAILQTTRNGPRSVQAQQQPQVSAPSASTRNSPQIDSEGHNHGNSIAVEVQLRPGGNPNPNRLSESADVAPDPADLEGFASSGANLRFVGQKQQRRRRKPNSLDRLASEIKFRFKRSAGAHYEQQLEPGDRLAAQPNFNRGQPSFGSRLGSKHDASTKSRGHPDKRTVSRPKDMFVASESAHLNEVPVDESEDADEDSSDLDEDSSASNAAPREVDLDEEMGDEPGDDSPANFDADDEPYNQGASSDRDYNSPTSFEIPQIDINPDALKQKGCRTVLREVQEIPMNGLGVVQANGQPGSGYGGDQKLESGNRYKRNVARGNDNLINSRKVTSIVMTKECHFPNDPIDLASDRANNRQPSFAQQHAKPPAQHQQQHHQDSSKRQQSQYQVSPVALGSALAPQLAREGLKVIQSTPRVALKETGANKSIQMKADAAPVMHHPPEAPASQIRRRSVGQLAPPPARLNDKSPTSYGPVPMATAASKRNEVVAQKFYKPPSDDDPYHTLSYSSKNGADPDMDQDDDDNSVMSPDSDSDAAPQRRYHNRNSSKTNRGRQANSKRQQNSARLSESERRTLHDPDHEDTDPMPAAGRHEPEEPEFRSAPDADENDEGIDEPPVSPKPRENKVSETRAKKQSPDSSSETSRRDAPAKERYGKSFRFEHSVSRPQAERGLASQLRQLGPGRQTLSRTETDGIQRRLQPTGGKRPNASPLARRDKQSARQLEVPEEPVEDEADDEESDDAEPSRHRRPAASDHQTRATPPEDPDEDPDYNPSEAQVPANGKPRKVEKSFAYVHRDAPKKNSGNPDDFVVSYGRGNLQTEHEDYDSDRDPANNSLASNDVQPATEPTSGRAKRRAGDERSPSQWQVSGSAQQAKVWPANWPTQQVHVAPQLTQRAAQYHLPYGAMLAGGRHGASAGASARQTAQHYYPYRPVPYVG